MINDFLHTEYDELDKQNKNNDLHGERYLAVITSLGDTPCTEPTIPPITEISSPFKDKSPEQCSQLLEQETQRPNVKLVDGFFVILDERTIRDSTVLIVGYQNEENPVVTLRARSGIAQGFLLAMSVVHPDIGEFVYRAEQEEDEVLKE